MARGSAAKRPDPAELQREIESAQRRLAATIDALAERASPAGIARRQLRGLRRAGSSIVEEMRAVATGAQTVRRGSHIVDPPEGSVVAKGDEEIVATYEPRRVPPFTVLAGVGAGVAVGVGVVIWMRRRRAG